MIRRLGRTCAGKGLRIWPVAIVLAVLTPPAPAAVRTWNGSVSADWAVGANWDGGVAPVNGDDLLFPVNAIRRSVTNTLTSFQPNSFTFEGSNYVLYGNAVLLVGNITLNNIRGTNVFQVGISLQGNSTFSCTNTAAVLLINGDIALGSSTLVVDGSGTNLCAGAISGLGSLTKNGSGLLRFSGNSPNTYAGFTTVNQGLLQLSKPSAVTAVPGNLVVGNDASLATVRFLAAHQVDNGAGITVRQSSELDLNGFDDVVGGLTLHGGTVSSGSGTLTIRGNITTQANTNAIASVISGKLAFGGETRTLSIARGASSLTNDLLISAVISDGGPAAGLVKTGTGYLRLTGANIYSGLTTISGGRVFIKNNTALGAAGSVSNGTVVNTGGRLELDGVSVGTEFLTFNSVSGPAVLTSPGTSSWAGPVASSGGTVWIVDGTLMISGAVSGTNILYKDGDGSLVYSGTSVNTYSGTHQVRAGTLLLAKTVLNSAMVGNINITGDGQVRLQNNSQLPNSVAVSVGSLATLDLNGISEFFGGLEGNGLVKLGTSQINPPTIQVGNNGLDTTFSGTITGPGSFEKAGEGIMTLTGNNTYNGTTTILGGTLRINGSQPQSPVILDGGNLEGSGTVGYISAFGPTEEGGTMSAGVGVSSGILNGGSLTLSAVSTVIVDLTGGPVAGAGYDQIDVQGAVDLGGATLVLTNSPGFSTIKGEPLVIINNDGVDAVLDTFDGLTNGALVAVGGFKFKINYRGGTGNDVTLTLDEPPAVIATNILTGGLSAKPNVNECNLLYIVMTNTSGANLDAFTATLTSLTPHVLISQAETIYPALAAGRKATNSTAFLLSTLPSYNCLSNIDLVLSVVGTFGRFTVDYTLPVGSPGAPVRFQNTNSSVIPDVATLTSTNIVSGFVGPVENLAVALYLTHPFDGDLTNISLTGPDGTTVRLSGNVGGGGDDYGNACSDVGYTLFDDHATTSITNGVAPFVGTYRPLQPLSVYNSKTGTNANGAWILRISDGYPGSSGGILHCWSLLVSPRACADGGGYCPSCPGTVADSITTSDPTNAIQLLSDGIVSSCAEGKICPDTTNSAVRYDVYRFTNERPAETCVSVALDADCALSVAAYQGNVFESEFDPNDLCGTYIADMGANLSFGLFSFIIDPADIVIDEEGQQVITPAVFYVVVSRSVSEGNDDCDYVLQTSGIDCLPVLAIAHSPSNKVEISWSVSSPGYQLKASSRVENSIETWTNVPTAPGIRSGHYVVTNSVNANLFYRLRRP